MTFASRLNYLPEAHGVFNYKAYVYEHGTLKMLGVLPDGSIPPGGSNLVAGGHNPRGREEVEIETKDSISTDGSRILFEVNELPGQIFMRKNGTRSVMVTESETSEPVTAENVYLEAATPDLKHILFRTSTRLLDNAPEGGADSTCIRTGRIPKRNTISPYIGPGYGNTFEGSTGRRSMLCSDVSDDGSRVYYHTGDLDLIVWEAGRTRHIAVFRRTHRSV